MAATLLVTETTAATATAEGLISSQDHPCAARRRNHRDYQDANPATSVSKSARVDLEAPVVTLVSPVDGFFTNIATVTMSAEVTDAGAGVDQANIELKINGAPRDSAGAQRWSRRLWTATG